MALGAGAMASGVGFAMKSLRSGVEIVCVQPENAPAVTLALRAGRAKEAESLASAVLARGAVPDDPS